MAEPRPVVEKRGDLWLIWIPKGLVVLTEADLVRALRRGKAYQRQEQLKKRLGESLDET